MADYSSPGSNIIPDSEEFINVDDMLEIGFNVLDVPADMVHFRRRDVPALRLQMRYPSPDINSSYSLCSGSSPISTEKPTRDTLQVDNNKKPETNVESQIKWANSTTSSASSFPPPSGPQQDNFLGEGTSPEPTKEIYDEGLTLASSTISNPHGLEPSEEFPRCLHYFQNMNTPTSSSTMEQNVSRQEYVPRADYDVVVEDLLEAIRRQQKLQRDIHILLKGLTDFYESMSHLKDNLERLEFILDPQSKKNS